MDLVLLAEDAVMFSSELKTINLWDMLIDET